MSDPEPAPSEPRDSVSLWIDPGFGASGDMLLGGLAGYLEATGRAADADTALRRLADVAVDGYRLVTESVTRCGLAARRVAVDLTDDDGHSDDKHGAAASEHGRRWPQIDRLLANGGLPERVEVGARATFRRLGEVEAAQHGVDLESVHFHEVGAVDSIVDIVGAWLLLDAIGPARVVVGPVGLGHGSVAAAHGRLPLPAPATTALLTGAPIRSVDTDGETCTPTGAALLVEMADTWGPIPSGVVAGSARGAGGRDPASHPNVVTVIGVSETTTAGSHDQSSPSGAITEAALLVECNIDDSTPEVLAIVIQRLLDAGADDAWIVPVVMKKGRAAAELRVLTKSDRHDAIVELLLAETGSLGCRTIAADKHVLPRSVHHVDLRGRSVAIKVGPHSAKPELDELVALSDATGVPVRQLDIEARLAWQQRGDEHRDI